MQKILKKSKTKGNYFPLSFDVTDYKLNILSALIIS